MGRYYSGDIEGKFMFAVQPSNAPEIFGAEILDSNYVEYWVERDKLPFVKSQIKKLLKEHGDGINRVKKMYKSERGWNDDIKKEYGVTRDDLEHYANLALGEQIRDYIEENEMDCHITAEL